MGAEMMAKKACVICLRYDIPMDRDQMLDTRSMPSKSVIPVSCSIGLGFMQEHKNNLLAEALMGLHFLMEWK
jgi:hypothetical protein